MSNIAWDRDDDADIARLLERYKIDAIDIAPSKYFPDFAQITSPELASVRHWWLERGIEITGMQSLLFGTSGLNLFGPRPTRNLMLQHLAAVCRIGAGLGATRLVFGSPKNRNRAGLNDQDALDIAIPFFQKLGDIALDHGVIICLEPNPTRYGANFMTDSDDTARVVTQIGHPAIQMQFDIGAVAINGENADGVLKKYGHLVGHIHVSEPDLVPLGDGNADHEAAATAIANHLSNHIICIEMVATRDDPHLVSIERALNVATMHYCDRGASA